MNNMYYLIDKLCKKNRITVAQMCRGAGVSRGNLSDLKMGRTAALSTKTLTKIAAYFDIPIDFLIADPEDMDKVELALFGAGSEKSAKKEPATDGDELSKKQLMLIDFARSVPADKIDLVLRVMQSIVEADE